MRSSGKPVSGMKALWLLAVVVVATITIPGCGGCGGAVAPPAAKSTQDKKDARERIARSDKEKKRDFEIGRMLTQPNSNAERLEARSKQGHWFSATLELTANNGNFRGDLLTSPQSIEGSAFKLGTSRPVTLPKGQKKHLEVTLFTQIGTPMRKLDVEVVDQSGGTVATSPAVFSDMFPHEYFCVVLAKVPAAYQFLDESPCCRIVEPELMSDEMHNVLYHVVRPEITNRTPLPSNPLTWTSIACVVWDGLPETVLSPEQQQAMLDWLHWGGTLIVSGPDSLAALQSSFLGPDLPRTQAADLQVTSESIRPIQEKWGIEGVALQPISPIFVEKLTFDKKEWNVLAETADSIPLTIEHRVGAGRVVVTAFRMSQSDFVTWAGYDGFINACLFRRPARHFRQGGQVSWIDELPVFDGSGETTRSKEARRALSNYDARVGTKVRLFARDVAPRVIENQPEELQDDGFAGAIFYPQMNYSPDYLASRRGMAVAAWDDSSGLPSAVRGVLVSAAGIEVPKPEFVTRLLLIYLAMLVPLNWLVFKLMKRVEWAWFVVIPLAIGFSIYVVKAAQLNIGFARAHTEIAVVETQPNYSRAHVTRFTALYTSLSTTYDVVFDDPTALAQPFEQGTQMLAGQLKTEVNFRRDEKARLSGFEVSSNATSLLRSETMMDMAGGIQLITQEDGSWLVKNNTEYSLQDASVVWVPDNEASFGLQTPPNTQQPYLKNIRRCWIGNLLPGASMPVVESKQDQGPWRSNAAGTAPAAPGETAALPTEPSPPEVLPPAGSPPAASPPEMSAAAGGSDKLELRALIALAENTVERGEIRLVGLVVDALPGMVVEPAAAQVRQSALMVAHLKGPALPKLNTDTLEGGTIRRPAEVEEDDEPIIE